MFGIQHYGQFVLSVLLFQLIPGAGALAILSATARRGVATGMASVMGMLMGDAVWMLGAMLGLATVMQANPVVFTALQWFGVLYLVWLAIGLLRAGRSEVADDTASDMPGWQYGRQAMLVSLTNPKVMLFFVAFFPLFLQQNAGVGTLVAMVLHVSVISLLYQTGLVLVGNLVAEKLHGIRSVQVWAKRAAGVALLGFAARLALNIKN